MLAPMKSRVSLVEWAWRFCPLRAAFCPGAKRKSKRWAVNCWPTCGNDLTNHELMSRIGNKAVEIPDKVKVNVDNDGAVSVEGPKGKLQWKLQRQDRASVKDNQESVMRQAESSIVKDLYGLSLSMVHNIAPRLT